jgi:hypothetical protein
MQGKAITTWAGVVLGVVRTVEVILYDLVGSGNIDLIDVVNLGPRGNGKGGGDDKGGGCEVGKRGRGHLKSVSFCERLF